MTDTPTDQRARAYRAGSDMAKERLRREAPLDAEALERVQAADILVVPGSYDRVEQVLGALGTPHTVAPPEALARARLRPEQLVVVNCPGHLERALVEKLRTFVHAGGSLFTTDWALHHVLEPAFPGVVAYNGRATRDDVVRIEVRANHNPFLDGVLDGRDDPVWWLEAPRTRSGSWTPAAWRSCSRALLPPADRAPDRPPRAARLRVLGGEEDGERHRPEEAPLRAPVAIAQI